MPNLNSKFASVTEDTVNCFYFTANVTTEPLDWETLCDALNHAVNSFSMNYLWHKDKLQVFQPLTDTQAEGVPEHLRSCTVFGDNIEDEWFIVYLIFELTKQFTDLIVQIQDNDGHFLLIEAADCLPKWINPENTNNRVFIYKGDIHIIPPALIELDEDLSIEKAIDVIVNNSQGTKAVLEIQQAIKKVISSYPEKIIDSIHKALVKVPLEVAAVLKLAPELIAPIVNAYCDLDVIDAKLCKNLKLAKDTVCIQVNFTKCLYAMLAHSKLLNPASNKLLNKNDKQSTLGVKIFHGYKIIMNECSDISSTKDYKRFLNNLKVNGYFKENMEGSKEYTTLLKKASQYYSTHMCPTNKNVCNKIQNLLSTEDFKIQLQSLKESDDSSLDEDSEEWLYIHPEELNDLLLSRYGQQAQFKSDATPQVMTEQLSSFLHQTSDFEGIEINPAENEEDNDEIEFDTDLFCESLKNVLNLIAPKNGNTVNDSSSDCDEEFFQEDMALDTELRETLSSDIIKQNSTENKKFIYDSFLQGVKEEGQFGPSSNLLKSIAKKGELDSDDDVE